MPDYRNERIQAFDFFSGCGGTAAGLTSAGIEVILGLDNDADAAATYRQNFQETIFLERDITTVTVSEIERAVSKRRNPNQPLLISACAPCQPFSRLKKTSVIKQVDPRVKLLDCLKPFIVHFRPEYLFIENVPGFAGRPKETPLLAFKEFISGLGYVWEDGVVHCQDFGVPQVRKRLVMLATRLNESAPWPEVTHGPKTSVAYRTIWEAIGDLPPIKAGEKHMDIANHEASSLSKLNLERIEATPEGGSRKSWPSHLRLKCHDKEDVGYSDVYGRLRKDSLSPAITTRCISLSNGRFGHPDQNRAISVREAACLQTFPRSFTFKGSLISQARQVGNAVPVKLSESLGLAFASHYKKWLKDINA